MIRPVLFVNKMDRYLRELKYDAETMYQKLCQVIDTVNIVISQYDVPEMVDETMGSPGNAPSLLCEPDKGNVAFGSGFEQWGFTITNFARKYAVASGVSLEDMTKMLWGDWFYNKKKKSFTTE